ncbi:MAG: hypothetical protein ACLR6B_10525 [Blautia sp.]
MNALIRSLPLWQKSLREAKNPGLVSGGDGTGSQTPERPEDPETYDDLYEKTTWARSASLEM